MNVASLDDLIGALRESGLFDDEQLAELTDLAARFPNPQSLTRELEGRGWLTTYQAQELLAGRGRELVFGQYVVLSLLGEGGMGKVLKARHRLMKRIVALKMIRPTLLAQPRAVERFHREIEAVARLAHPNIVAAYDADQVGGTHFLVMEYVDGTDLARLVKRHGPLSAGMASECIRQAALGLEHAFAQGLVHRDIKPHNLLLSRGQPPVVKILDMGLARLQVGEGDGLTHTGAVMGTPDFIAPEQASDSHKVDIRADLYSLGCTLYFLPCGKAPFPGGTALEKLFKHQYVAPRPIELRRPDVPPDVAAVVAKLMAKRPEDRYQTPAELVAALTPLAGGESELLAETLLHLGSVADDDEPFGTMRPAGPAADTMEPQAAATRTDEPPEPSAGASARSPGDWSAKPVPYVAPGPPPVPAGPKAPPRLAPARRVPLMIALVLTGAVVATPGAVALWMMLHPPDQTGLANVMPTEAGPLPTAGPTSRSATEATTERRTPKDTRPLDTGPKQTGKPLQDTGKAPPTLLPEAVVCRFPTGTVLRQVAFAGNAPRAVGSTTQNLLFVCDLESLSAAGEPRFRQELDWGGGEFLRPPVPAASGIAITSDGKAVYYGTRSRKTGDIRYYSVFRLWDDFKSVLANDTTLGGQLRMMDVTCVALSEKGHIALTGTADLANDSTIPDRKSVLVWDVKGRETTLAQRFGGHGDASILAVAVSPDGKWAASSGLDDDLRLWNVSTLKQEPSLWPRPARVRCIAFSPNGQTVAFGGDDDTNTHLVNLSSRQEMVFGTPENVTKSAIRSLAFSADGSRVIAGNASGYVLIWDVKAGQELTAGHFRHDAGPVIAVGLSSDARYAYSAAAGTDNTIRRWQAPPAP
jgi:serine/threonine-protein kinase